MGFFSRGGFVDNVKQSADEVRRAIDNLAYRVDEMENDVDRVQDNEQANNALSHAQTAITGLLGTAASLVEQAFAEAMCAWDDVQDAIK